MTYFVQSNSEYVRW